MTLRSMLALAVLSTAGFMPGAVRGQSVEAPRSFEAHVEGNDVVARWWGTPEADLYVGEIDEDPSFDSPRRWAVRDDGRQTYEFRMRDLAPGVYYVRLSASESFLIIQRRSAWTHVERVAVGRDADSISWPDRDGSDPWDARNRGTWDDRVIQFPTQDDHPRNFDARAFGDEIRIAWTSVRASDRYVLQLSRDLAFRQPIQLALDGFRDRSAQAFVIRNVPGGRWYLRVRSVESLVSRTGFRWSEVEVVNVAGGAPVVRREVDFRDARDRDDRDDRRDDWRRDGDREHPVFDEHPGRGKGHLKHHDNKHGRGHDDD